MHGVLGLAHSARLQVVGYAAGSGDAGLACGMARMPASFIFSHERASWTSRYAPHCVAVRVHCDHVGTVSVRLAEEVPDVQPLYETTRGASCIIALLSNP
jgi:hypothetical protein